MADFASLTGMTGERIVYVRPIALSSLPAEVRDEVEDEVGGEGPVYAIHGPDGAVLALAGDRRLAFEIARMNHLAPLSVH
jgi:hypothetical protein